MVSYECDYPHSDTLWPNAPERLWETVRHLSAGQIEKITHRNAMRHFSFELFSHDKREELSVGALRARAAAANVDVTPRSAGGAKPLGEGEALRRVTSGDLFRMFSHHEKTAAR